jgi:hypothetical protein
MILTFQKRFIPLILEGKKEQTIRQHKLDRWRNIKKVQFYDKSPRNHGKQFGEAEVDYVQEIKIRFEQFPNMEVTLGSQYKKGKWWGFNLLPTDPEHIALSDGFECGAKDMYLWFWERKDLKVKEAIKEKGFYEFKGVIIVWRNFKEVTNE